MDRVTYFYPTLKSINTENCIIYTVSRDEDSNDEPQVTTHDTLVWLEGDGVDDNDCWQLPPVKPQQDLYDGIYLIFDQEGDLFCPSAVYVDVSAPNFPLELVPDPYNPHISFYIPDVTERLT